MPLLVDTGPLYALADKSEPDHKKVKTFFESQRELLIVPWAILPELAYLLSDRIGPQAELAMVHSLNQKELTIEGINQKDMVRCEQILSDYPDFGLVDSITMAMAERLKIKQIVTFDHRDFSRFRPSHCDSFVLLP